MSRRPAFTLIELLVVVSIVAVLIGLLLSAVQKVRGAAARLQCQNNLKQVGIALHAHHDARGALPPGCSYQGGADPQPHMSWMTRLLPYLEQEPLHRRALAAFAQSRFFQEPPHLPVLKTVIPGLACPADGRAARTHDFGPFEVAFTSYLGVSGMDYASLDGVLYLDSYVRLTDVRDGTSNTLAVGERPPSADFTLGWWYAGWGQIKTGSAESHLGARERNVHERYPECGPGPFAFSPGRVTNNCDLFHFWSLHTGGGNFLLADGAVRFLGYSNDKVTPHLATRAGGEVNPLPD